MDEATSNLDAITERALDKTISEFSKDVTTIFIAHRLSTIKNCDKIYVLEDGKIIESGDHASLTALGGKYAQLVKQQSLDTVDVKATHNFDYEKRKIMKPIIVDLKDISDSTEVYDSKPNRFVPYTIYIICAILAIALIWMYLFRMDIV